MSAHPAPAPGARALIRDEEWLIQSADPCTLGGHQVSCIGLSETVRNRRALFLTTLDTVTLIDPAKTELVVDDSPAFLAARLYIEARLRQATPTDDALVLGHRGVMDALPFQLTPAHQVLGQLRPRLLIADTVGLGKTLEAGILTAELIRRGKARRVLVVTTKGMMRQFQQEFWSRFTIALTRLDSAGIARIRREIPANHNPFNYYDRTIVSVDTLKREGEYRHYVEQAWWDLIIIDEAHNVSYKGNRAQTNRLANLLAQRSDALILLTATPHNGRKDSFASLMRMLDPTVLPAGADYRREDVAHLFVRRFKKDVRAQIRRDFPERAVYKLAADASPVENRAFDCLAELRLTSDRAVRHDGAMLFRTTVEKALFSSPAACVQTLTERLRKLAARDPAHPDLPALRGLGDMVAAITPEHFSKYRHLLEQLRSGAFWTWNGQDPHDRLVIFTERIETLNFLHKHLPRDLGLRDDALGILHGQLSDQEIQQTVEAFGKTHAPLRLLIASDVASEGLNLHYQAYRVLHFDIPWSLMVFQQRNGRVDRYAQTQVPRIGYLLTQPHHERIRGDLRILEILIEKDEQAARNIGDPSAFMGLYDEELEIARVAAVIEGNSTAAAFAAQLADGDLDPFEALWGAAAEALAEVRDPATAPRADLATAPTAPLPSLFADDYRYVRDALRRLRASAAGDQGSSRTPPGQIEAQFDDARRTLSLQPDADLARLLERELAPEMRPRDNQYALCADPALVAAAIATARDGNDWPQVHYLWPLHPIAQWLDYKLLALFGRRRAPVARVGQGIAAGEAIVLVLAQVPNRRGQPMLTRMLGIRVAAHGQPQTQPQPQTVLTLAEVLELTGLGSAPLANDGRPLDIAPIQAALPAVIQVAERHLKPLKQTFDAECKRRLGRELAKLETQQDRHFKQLEFDFSTALGQVKADRKRRQEAATADLFAQYQDWIRQTLELDDRAQFTVVAALVA